MTNLFILLFSLLACGFAGLVLILRQPMRAALALVAHMICLAGIYACLEVHVIALFQVLIYVGAVMVFMVYTIMLLDDRDSSYRHVYSRLACRRSWSQWPWPVRCSGCWARLPGCRCSGLPLPPHRPLALRRLSVAFMSQYWFHFELATVLLLVGIVAAWTAIRRAGDPPL
jgi:NADH-quinone oxidoreductase subunit J